MYKLLLCWRYLRTRWIALASVVSVTLGVATMIVVNAVMAGFSHEMQDRIHGILSDIVFATHSDSGFQDPDWHMREIRRVAGDAIAGMTPTVTTPAMIRRSSAASSQRSMMACSLGSLDPSWAATRTTGGPHRPSACGASTEIGRRPT